MRALYEVLKDCSNAIKTATANQNKDFQISEELKTEARESHKKINMKSLFFYMLVTYYASFFSILAILLPILIFYRETINHPNFLLAKIWLLQGASYNQVQVIYHQVFKHFVQLKYIVLVALIIFTVSISHYVYNFDSCNFKYYLIPDSVLVHCQQEFGYKIFSQYEKISFDLLFSKDWLYFIFGFSTFRELSSNLNALSIFVLIVFRLVQIIRRPK
jgi:hypothetical protein